LAGPVVSPQKIEQIQTTPGNRIRGLFGVFSKGSRLYPTTFQFSGAYKGDCVASARMLCGLKMYHREITALPPHRTFTRHLLFGLDLSRTVYEGGHLLRWGDAVDY
jgi:hypothetical protein